MVFGVCRAMRICQVCESEVESKGVLGFVRCVEEMEA